jgi:hypothetical protein
MEEFGSAIEVEERISNANKNYFHGNFASLRVAATIIGILGESKKLGSKRFAHFAGFAS